MAPAPAPPAAIHDEHSLDELDVVSVDDLSAAYVPGTPAAAFADRPWPSKAAAGVCRRSTWTPPPRVRPCRARPATCPTPWPMPSPRPWPRRCRAGPAGPGTTTTSSPRAGGDGAVSACAVADCVALTCDSADLGRR